MRSNSTLLKHTVVEIRAIGDYCINFAIDGELMTPDGRNPYVRVLWAIDTGKDFPRLISAIPAKRGRDV